MEKIDSKADKIMLPKCSMKGCGRIGGEFLCFGDNKVCISCWKKLLKKERKRTGPHKCQMEGCRGVATGHLWISDKETLKDIDVCTMCWEKIK